MPVFHFYTAVALKSGVFERSTRRWNAGFQTEQSIKRKYMWNLDVNPEETALLLVDVINDLAFDGGDDLLFHALPMATQLVDLKAKARAAGDPHHLCQRQLWPLALGFSEVGALLPAYRCARQGDCAYVGAA